MRDFKDDMVVLLHEGVIAPKCNRIRFIFRKSNVLEGDLDNLELSERAYNCLRRGKITNIKDIVEKWDELGRLRGAGAKTIKEVKNKYLSYYYSHLDEEECDRFWKDTIEATNDI